MTTTSATSASATNTTTNTTNTNSSATVMSTTTESQSIYPIIKTDQEVQFMINSTINDKNAQIVKTAVQNQNTSLTHYEKILTRWSKGKTVANVLFYSLFFVETIVSIIFRILMDKNIIPNSMWTEYLDAFIIVIVVPFSSGLYYYCNCNVEKFTTICNNIQKCINQSYIYWNQAVTDNTITDDELTNFNNIFSTSNTQVKAEEAAPIMNTASLVQEIKTIFTQGLTALEKIQK